MRVGSRWIRRHDRPQTAYERLVGSQLLPAKERRSLEDFFQSLDPFLLARQVEQRLKPILKIANQGVQHEK